MSSLAAARADNFYHPPDWDPRKRSRAEHATAGGGKLSKKDKWKAHPLRERAKKLATDGVLTIRFEMPFNVRCTGCGNHIGKGVRYNAEKKTIGKYFSTSIYSFRMLCHCEDGTSRTCQRRNPHWIEIHTDPKNADYVIMDGAVRIAERSVEDAEELGVEPTLDAEEAAKRSANPFYRLERLGAAARKKPWLEALEELREERYHDDYEANRKLRRAHRSSRAEALVASAVCEAKGIRVPLGEEEPADVHAARAVPFEAARRASSVRRSEKQSRLRYGSIFGSTYTTKEEERLQRVQQRRERGMRVVSAPAAAHAASHAAASSSASSRQPPNRLSLVPVCSTGARVVEGLARAEPEGASQVTSYAPLEGARPNEFQTGGVAADAPSRTAANVASKRKREDENHGRTSLVAYSDTEDSSD